MTTINEAIRHLENRTSTLVYIPVLGGIGRLALAKGEGIVYLRMCNANGIKVEIDMGQSLPVMYIDPVD